MGRMGWTGQIAEAGADDAPQLASVINRAFAIERFFMTADRTTVEEVRRLLAAGAFLVVRDHDGALPACVYVERRGDRLYVGMLSVDPSRQKTGLGRLLMDAAETRAATLGCRGVDIRVVNLREELPPFYLARGYVERGEEAFEHPHAMRPAHYILMSKDFDA